MHLFKNFKTSGALATVVSWLALVGWLLCTSVFLSQSATATTDEPVPPRWLSQTGLFIAALTLVKRMPGISLRARAYGKNFH